MSMDSFQASRPTAAIVSIMLTACLSAEERTMVEFHRSTKQEITSTLRSYLEASVEDDTVTMLRLGTHQARNGIREAIRLDAPAVQAAANSLEARSLELGYCQARLFFHYTIAGEQREGVAEADYQEGWRFTLVAPLIEID